MTSPLKDVLLIGYGAVGAIYSLILKRSSGARVTVVARSNFGAANAHGMDIRSAKYGNIQGWRPDRLFPKLEHALDRPYAYVFLTTKAIPELQRTPALLAPLLSDPYANAHPQPTYVLMQNGLGVETELYDALKRLKPEEEPRIVSTAVWIGTNLVSQNHVEQNAVEHNDFDRVSMGIYRRTNLTATENTPAEAALLDELADLLRAGGSQVTVVPEIQRVKFAKNMWNAVLGASAALARESLRAFFRPPECEPGYEPGSVPPPTPQSDSEEPRTESERRTADVPRASPALGQYTIPLLYDALQELSAVGQKLFASPENPDGPVEGIDPDVAYKTLLNTARIHARPDSKHLASMLVDVQAGRPMEVEHVIGEVVRMGRRAGVAMPRMETLYALLLVVQNQALRKYREGASARPQL
ncbi:6-phosphogluconate dehydrogenase C-terminal domain-like protein [Polyporus arcularius HHB13444]|uniref:6-phosphogluconate dehydrogenase C-terminal domain-like protein n=1 Tax=Polyporus arcularius HHB13444 TaxID=1314778 RepID=A0A5C3NWQ6_9APHY|nr:6-phosphogluconate dehydrogenase C-terminal domain-like protein [Polyporus arcularius HHB13444]